MPAYVYPTEFLFWTPNHSHFQHKKMLMPMVENKLKKTKGMQEKHWLCEVNTEFFCAESCSAEYIQLVTQAIYPALDEMLKAVANLNQPATSKVTKIWYNYYEPEVNNGQEVHTHHGSTYSGIYFLHLEEPNTTVFYSNVAANCPGLVPPTKKTDFVSEGDVLIFPSTLMHYVTPSARKRITVAFNIECSYET